MSLTQPYYKYNGHKGERFFKMIKDSSKVVLVCVSPGAIKSGRGNAVGIYLVERSSVDTGYSFLSDFKEAVKEEFDQAFRKILEKISQ